MHPHGHTLVSCGMWFVDFGLMPVTREMFSFTQTFRIQSAWCRYVGGLHHRRGDCMGVVVEYLPKAWRSYGMDHTYEPTGGGTNITSAECMPTVCIRALSATVHVLHVAGGKWFPTRTEYVRRMRQEAVQNEPIRPTDANHPRRLCRRVRTYTSQECKNLLHAIRVDCVCSNELAVTMHVTMSSCCFCNASVCVTLHCEILN